VTPARRSRTGAGSHRRSQVLAIEDLLAVVPPPARPIDPGDPGAWPKVEQALGTKLPSDYRDYGTRYGSGVLGHDLFVYNPFSPFYLDGVKNTGQLFGLLHKEEADYFPDDVSPPLPEGEAHTVGWPRGAWAVDLLLAKE
jgi:hypothetical protein